MIMAILALAALALGVGSLLVIGGVIFAPFLFGLFGLALVGVLSGLNERTVRQRNPELNPTGWRDGSQVADAP